MNSTKTKSRKAPKPITAEEFDAKFENGDISEYLDLSSARAFAPGEDETLDLTPQKVNVNFPSWVVAGLDSESERLGVPRQSLIKVWIAERLESESARH